jgi:hypothetical protein
LPRQGDTFLKAVLEQDAPTWLRQMDHDLEVLHAGQRYAEQLISALRAIVALDGQQLQRKLEGEEKARNRLLQLTIFLVGAALSFSGLAAATRPRPAARLLAMLTNQRPATAAATGQQGFHAAGLWLADIGQPFPDRRARGPQLVWAMAVVWAVAMPRQTVQALTPGNIDTAQQARANASRALMSPRSACWRAAM